MTEYTMSEAFRLLNDLICRHTVLQPQLHPSGPGQVILKLPNEKRQILKNLSSDEVSKVRPDMIGVPKKKGRWGL